MAKRDQPDLIAMVDTQVMIFGCRAQRASDRSDVKAACHNSRVLLLQMSEIHINPVAWVEFKRALRKDEAESLTKLGPRIKLDEMNGAVSDSAAEFLSARGQQAICRKCHNAIASNPCLVCGSKIAGHQRVVGAIITAHAETNGMTLYSYDGGIHDLLTLPPNVRPRFPILYPPDPNGPLFNRPP